MLTLDRQRITPFLDDNARADLQPRVEAAHRAVLDGSGTGGDMLGWRDLVLDPDTDVLDRVVETAEEIHANADVLVCIGIGGSYLGAQAVISALTPYFSDGAGPEIVFAGHHLSPSYHERLLDYLKGKSVYVNVISKSGSTLEPALAFRFVRRFLEQSGDDAAERIIATTGPTGGLLNPLRDEKGYRKFVRALMDGAGDTMRALEDLGDNPANDYAADRFLLHEAGYKTELLAVMEPRLYDVGAWWQQLFGESEGKEHKGLFPSVAQYTSDLHSLGQYVQQGQRTLVETFLLVDEAGDGPTVREEDGNPDQLNYLAGKNYADVDRAAYEGTAAAHAEGGVPNWTLTLPRLDARSLGEAIAFFEHAVAVGGYLLEVNPFDQPGVENYKQKMFTLLGRP
jgi:glucose-6-phosphate isomerase